MRIIFNEKCALHIEREKKPGCYLCKISFIFIFLVDKIHEIHAFKFTCNEIMLGDSAVILGKVVFS